MFNLFKEDSEKAFTFIEILAAMIALSIGILSVIAITSKSYSAIAFQKNKLVATYLAKEGVELVRNVRSENWLNKGNSDCNEDDNVVTCSNGQTSEDSGDCDWRCGIEMPTYNYKPLFKLGVPVTWTTGNPQYLVDLEYYNGDWVPVTSTNPLTNCKDVFDLSYTPHFPFGRLLIITRNADLNGDGILTNDLRVQSIVCWQQGGRWQEVSIEDHLFNWKK